MQGMVIVVIVVFWYFRDNALESENESPSNDEDESEMFKRTPGWGRRRRRRRGWFRKLKNKFKKIGHKIHGGAKKVCAWLKNSERKCKPVLQFETNTVYSFFFRILTKFV